MPRPDDGRRPSRWPLVLSLLFGMIGLGLAADSAMRSSATYDEITYLKVAARWWRTGDQDPITRLGSPSLFWKLQQSVPLWCLDRAGFGRVIDEPERYQSVLLPLVRLACLPIWALGLAITAFWARRMYGSRAMIMASALFAMSPNLLAHAPLATMETPLIASSAAIFFFFWSFLQTRDRRWFIASAVATGVAFSCKYTTVLMIPLIALMTVSHAKRITKIRAFVTGSVVFLAIVAITNLLVTGCSLTPLSPNVGHHGTLNGRSLSRWETLLNPVLETPIPRELVGFAVQSRIQSQGGTSYLFGERRERGWWHYYPIALAVKMTPSVWMLILARLALLVRCWFPRLNAQEAKPGSRADAKSPSLADPTLPLILIGFFSMTILGSSRNYGIRYLLPLSPVLIVWLSGLAEAGPWARRLSWTCLLFQAFSLAGTHPHELSYFPDWVGGHEKGRYILSDSNLDWGQGLKSLARLQTRHPELVDLTLYYFGDTHPEHWGVQGRSYVIDASSYHPGLPDHLAAERRFLAVSTSLQFGPWGPDGYFSTLDEIPPLFTTDDGTIAVYPSSALKPDALRAHLGQ